VWLPRVPPIDRAYRSQGSDLSDLLWEHTHLHLSHHHHLTLWFHPFVYIRVVKVLWGVVCEEEWVSGGALQVAKIFCCRFALQK
jgi:hypothetical protein